ncbi:MAG: response regulator [Acidobacteriota bacterium]
MKLLIVDDSLIVRNAIARATAQGDITEVLRAEDGVEAIELYRTHRPALVTMDLTMPRLDGLGAISAIRALQPNASILVISALNSHKMAMDAISRGACGFLTKPFTESEVIDALDQLMRHARKHAAEEADVTAG